MNGYIPPRRTRDIEAPIEAAEGAEPFRATIVTNLTFAEIDAIPLTDSTTWPELFRAIAPYVIAWNAMGRNSETGAYEPLPAPSDAGPDVLRAIPTEASIFLATSLKTVHLRKSGTPEGDEREKK